MAQTPDGTPYVEGSDFVSGWPAVSMALAEQIDALRRMQPVGMITPYAGELNSADDLAAIDGWLPCDGKAYKRGDFPDLYARMSPWQVHTGFPPDTPNGSPNTANFYVPDFRGRHPVGAHNIGAQATPLLLNKPLGGRVGDERIPQHAHELYTYTSTNGPHMIANTGNGPSMWPFVSGPVHDPLDDTLSPVARNQSPATVVNFIVWTGTTTVGKSPISGVEVAPLTTRQMIEARLQEAGIGEEEIEMLRQHLAELKDGEK